MRYRPAQGILLEGRILQALLQRPQRCRESGGTGSDNHHVQHIINRREITEPVGNRIHRLPALLNRVADQTHTPQLAGNVNPGYVGFKIGGNVRNIHAPFFRAEDQGNGVDRTGRRAGPVPDAIGRRNQFRFFVDNADDILLRAGGNAGGAPHTQAGIDCGMK